MSKIIAVSNQKGGVGKTTTCVSLGAGLAALGKRVLLVDLDSQANLTMSLGHDPDELEIGLPDLFDAHELGEPFNEDPVIQTGENLHLLPSDLRLAGCEQGLHNVTNYEQRLLEILTPYLDRYDYILIDCPPSLSALTITALTAAQMVLVPVQCEFFAARGLIRLIEVIEAVRRHTNPDLWYRLVPTLYDKRNSICRRVLTQLNEHFSEHMLESVINVDTRLRESTVAGEPIVSYAPASRGSENYQQLAAEIINLLDSRGV
jgi:chromosome partitioning protein